MKEIIVLTLLCMGCFSFSIDLGDHTIADKYTHDIKISIENNNQTKLKDLLNETFQEFPVGDSLLGSELGMKYYALGSYLNEQIRNKNWDILLVLLNNGATTFIEDGKSPLVKSYLTSIIYLDDSELLLKFLNAGAKVNINSVLGNITPDLVYAVKKNKKNTFKALLNYGVDINQEYVLGSIGEYGSQLKYPIFKIVEKSDFLEIALNYNIDFTVEEVKDSLTIIENKESIIRLISYIEKIDGKYVISKRTEYLDYNK